MSSADGKPCNASIPLAAGQADAVDGPQPVPGLGSMPLLSGWKLGKFDLEHRMVYAPMTRDRGTGKPRHNDIVQDTVHRL